MNSKTFDFKDINLIPRFCIVGSRSECTTDVQLGKFNFKLPIYPANMESIINRNLAEKIAKEGYFYTMHRFLTTGQQLDFLKYMKSKNLLTSISIGVNYDSIRLLEKIQNHDLCPDFITVDIAHGHSVKMKKMLEYIKNSTKLNSFVIAGNISTAEAGLDLQDWGADAVKVGIGPGAVCITAMETGFGSRGMQAKSVLDVAMSVRIPVICDGGIKERGDIAKALTLGATMVMAGNMFAGFEESPGDIIIKEVYKETILQAKYKEYWGSASSGTAGKTDRIEGKKTLIPYKDKSIFEELNSIKESLQSAISYAGGKDLKAFDLVEINITK